MFKKGDKVYSILRGWGEIEDTDGFLHVRYPKGRTETYWQNGNVRQEDLIPELYHTEPVITVPKRRVEHTGWVAIRDTGDLDSTFCTRIYSTKEILENNCTLNSSYAIQQITYYTEE